MKQINSTELIGDVEKMYMKFLNRVSDNPFPYECDILWRAYYNGWIEGRANLMADLLAWEAKEE